MKILKSIFCKLLVFTFILTSFFTFNFEKNYADTFYSNVTNVILREDGSADFETLMDFEATKGTEYYIPIENLGKSEIVNFSVAEFIDGKEIAYQNVDKWNVKAGISEKKNKYGIVKNSSGYELCFGIGDYSRKTFILRYKVTNFVKILNDSDMIFWKFINNGLEAGPEKINITIQKENDKFDSSNSKIWGFGSKGTVNFKEGRIEFYASEKISRSNYVTILSKIDKGYFKGGEKISKDFSYYQDQAFKGSSYKKSSNSIFSFLSRNFKFVVMTIIIFIGAIFTKSNKIKGGHKRGEFKDEYYRDIPEKHWWNLSLVLESAGFDGYKAIIRAYFLKWIQNNLLTPVTEEEGFIFKKDVVSLKINSNVRYSFEDSTEERLFNMVRVAARDDMILQKNEFSKYLKDNKNLGKFSDLKVALENATTAYLSNKKYLDENKKFGNKKYNEAGKEFTEKLVKYYNYLNDFTLLDERELSEIKVWKELLIYATLFNVAETVEKQLKKLSPEFIEQQDIDVHNLHSAMIYSQVFSSSFIDAYTRSVEGSSSGGGGFTSIGGGGGSFGGSSGGGTR